MSLFQRRAVAPSPDPVLPFTVQTGSGKLSVTEQTVTLVKPGFPPKTITVMRTAIVGIERNVSIPPNLWGKGGSMHFVWRTAGVEKIDAHFVPYAAGVALMQLFGLS